MQGKRDGDYTPHLKKVLKSYHDTASDSLRGPNTLPTLWNGRDLPMTSGVRENDDSEPFVLPPPFPIQHPPIFTTCDQGRPELAETVLEDKAITCFMIGGEERLCLPEILNTILREFRLPDIHKVCRDLHIYIGRCNRQQLDLLKLKGTLPEAADSCGLITKTDAERLCSALLNKDPPKSRHKNDKSFKVYHKCFGKCIGLCLSDLYTTPASPCIECYKCKGLFTPENFVRHTHTSPEKRTCHWGFHSANWRSYLLLVRDQENWEYHESRLDELKAKFNKLAPRKRQLTETASFIRKRLCAESSHLPMIQLPWSSEFACWYHTTAPLARSSAFTPWTSSDSKMFPFQSIVHRFNSSQSNCRELPYFQSSFFPFANNRLEWQCQTTSSSLASKVRNKPASLPAIVPLDKKVKCKSESTIVKIEESNEAFKDSAVDMGRMKGSIKCDLENLQLLLREHQIEESIQNKILSKVRTMCWKLKKEICNQNKSALVTEKEKCEKENLDGLSCRDEIINNAKEVLHKETEIDSKLAKPCDSQKHKNTQSKDYQELVKHRRLLQDQLESIEAEIQQLNESLVPKMPSPSDSENQSYQANDNEM